MVTQTTAFYFPLQPTLFPSIVCSSNKALISCEHSSEWSQGRFDMMLLRGSMSVYLLRGSNRYSPPNVTICFNSNWLWVAYASRLTIPKKGDLASSQRYVGSNRSTFIFFEINNNSKRPGFCSALVLHQLDSKQTNKANNDNQWLHSLSLPIV